MVSIARKNLFQEKTRLAISAGGVAFAVLLMSILAGLYEGILFAPTNYVLGAKADVWVAQEGVSDMFHSFSMLQGDTKEELLQVGGVEKAYDLIGRNIEIEIKGKNVSVYLLGYDPESRVGGPAKIIAGEGKTTGKEILIDRVFAAKHGYKLNDRIEIKDQDYKIVGITEGNNLLLYQYLFMSKQEAEELLGQEGFVNFVLLMLKNPASGEKVAKEIDKEIPGVSAYSREDFAVKNRKTIEDSFVPIIAVLVIIAFVVGLVIVGLTIYSATLEKIREYGVLKAIGATNTQLYRIIFEQAIISALIGFTAGMGLLYVMAQMIDRLAPEFPLFLKASHLAIVLLAVMLMSLLAAYTPIKKIEEVDPAIVFKA